MDKDNNLADTKQLSEQSSDLPESRERPKPVPGRTELRTALVLPTMNAGKLFVRWIDAVKSQTFIPERMVVIDSSSTDSTPDLAKEAGMEVISIPSDQFSHGGTRQMAAEMLAEFDLILFLTQDAILSQEKSIERLVGCCCDPRVGAAYGRQLPREGAGCIEAHARLFNYPPSSHVRDLTDAPRVGIKASFISNSFSVWRRKALMEIGGFPRHTIQNEDAWAASKLLQTGWKIAYSAEAVVRHSHNYSYMQEFRRYFDIGVFHSRESWIRETFGEAGGEGLHYIRSEISYLARHAPLTIPSALLRDSLKLVGFKLGNHEALLPTRLKKQLSMNKRYWQRGNKP